MNQNDQYYTVDISQTAASHFSLLPLWQEGALCDVELEACDGVRVPAHKVVLASSSVFFKVLLAGTGRQMREGVTVQNGRLHLPGVDGPTLSTLLHAVYSQRVSLSAHSVQALLAGSGYLALDAVRDACCQYLRSRLSPSTCQDVLLLAHQYDCHDLQESTLRFMEARFHELVRAGGGDGGEDDGGASTSAGAAVAPLSRLPVSLMLRLLGSDSLAVSSEVEVARAAVQWLAADVPQRGCQAGQLLRAVRLPRAELLGLVESDFLWDQIPPCALADTRRAVLEGCARLDRPQDAAAATAAGPAARDAGATAWPSPGVLGSFPPRLAAHSQLMAVGGVDELWRSLRTVELYDPSRDKWTLGPPMPSACSFPAGATLGDYGVVIEGIPHPASVSGFHRRRRRWAAQPTMITPRAHMAAAALPGVLFVMGGRAGRPGDHSVLGEVECLTMSAVEGGGAGGGYGGNEGQVDPCCGWWRSLAPMTVPRCALGAAALGDAVYAVGGQSQRVTHATAEWFDPGRECWTPVATPMAEARKYLVAEAVAGRVFAVGGMTHSRERLASAEALDPREGRWHCLPPMTQPRSSCGAGRWGEELYVMGGIATADNQSSAEVECFCPRAGRWRRCAPMSHGRSGLAVLPV